MIHISGRHWGAAICTALVVHIGVAVVLLWQSSQPGAKQAGIGGIEVALGPTGSVAGPAENPTEEVAKTEAPSYAVDPQKTRPEAMTVEEIPEPDAEQHEPATVAQQDPVPVQPAPVTPDALEKADPPPPPPTDVSEPAQEERPEATPTPPLKEPQAVPSTLSGGGNAGAQVGSDEGVESDGTSGGGLPGDTADYITVLQTWLEKHKKYPRHARVRGQEGTVLLHFVLDRDGRVLEYDIQQSSGHMTLDKEVEVLIARAQPFPKIPAEVRQARLEFIVPVYFFLE